MGEGGYQVNKFEQVLYVVTGWLNPQSVDRQTNTIKNRSFSQTAFAYGKESA